MAELGAGVNLTGVGMIAAGAVLAYAGVNDPEGGPVGVVRDLLRGRTPSPGVRVIPTVSGGAVASAAAGGIAAGAAALGSGGRAAILAQAERYRAARTPYLWGGASLRGIDCSGLILVAYRDGAGILLPHRATLIAARGRRVPRAEARPGDVVAWGVPGNYPHAALVVDGTRTIEARTWGTVVDYGLIDRKAVPGMGFPDIIRILGD